jgi:hypothetical protein
VAGISESKAYQPFGVHGPFENHKATIAAITKPAGF